MQTSEAISFHFFSGPHLLYISIFASPRLPFGLRAVFTKFMGGFLTRMVGLVFYGFLCGRRTSLNIFVSFCVAFDKLYFIIDF